MGLKKERKKRTDVKKDRIKDIKKENVGKIKQEKWCKTIHNMDKIKKARFLRL